MASFLKDGKTWQYSVSRMVDGKYKPIRKGGFRTKKEAQVAAAEVELKLKKGINPVLRRDLFDEYFEQWVDDYKTGIKDVTLARYKSALKTIQEHFPGVYVQDITKRDYQRFMNTYGETHAKPTAQKLNSQIRACVKDAIDEGIIQVDFTRKVVITGKPSKKASEKHLDFHETELLITKLYASLEQSLIHYLILLALTSGMRFGELVGLTRKDFNFKTNIITVSKTWMYKKGFKAGFGPTKNEASNRIIEMDDKVMGEFKKLFKKIPENIHGLVFFDAKSTHKVLPNKEANKSLHNILEELKIKRITIHGLRHTHISILLYRKISIYYVAERAGHSTTETTSQTYAHVLKEMRAEDSEATINIFKKMTV